MVALVLLMALRLLMASMTVVAMLAVTVLSVMRPPAASVRTGGMRRSLRCRVRYQWDGRVS